MQVYHCMSCCRKFTSTRRIRNYLIKRLWHNYVFSKQTIRELVRDYDIDKREVRDCLNQYRAPQKIHYPRAIHLLADGIHFGQRTEETDWCVMVIRDPREQENLDWVFSDHETTYAYSLLREHIEEEGYIILSVTGDGFSGIKAAFHGIPYQMCQVHMERLVIKGTTRKPLTEAGKVLLALTKSLYETDSTTFHRRLGQYIEKYRGFLNEKTTHPLTGSSSWTHEGVRFALNALLRHKQHLFTFEQNKNIPKTTNSLEGHFSHARAIVGVHRGLGRPHKQKVLNSIFLAGTIAPDKKKLDEIL